MESDSQGKDQPGKLPQAFKYEYFLKKHEFLPWVQALNSTTDKNQYLAQEFAIVKRAETRNKAVDNLRISVFIQVYTEQLGAVVKAYQTALCSGTELTGLEASLSQLIQYNHTLHIFGDYDHNSQDKATVRKVLEKLDETFLYTNNMKLLVQIAACFLPHQKLNPTHFNWINLDLSLPESYYFARLEQLYKKYQKYFTCAEGLDLQPGLKKGHSELELIKMKSSRQQGKIGKKSSKDDKTPLQKLSLDELLEFKNMAKIATHLQRGYMSVQDKSELLISLKCLVLKKQYKANPNLKTDYLMQLYNFIRGSILNDSELALCEERQKFENTLLEMTSHLNQEDMLEVFLYTEPAIFLERSEFDRRSSAGELEKFLADQIDLIQKAFKTLTVPDGILVGLLEQENLFDFIFFVKNFVYSFESIFASTGEVKIYKYYVKMLRFLKEYYFSFAEPDWHYPLELMNLINSEDFDQFHEDIKQDIKDITKKLVVSTNGGVLPTYTYFHDGKFVTRPVSKLQVFQAIKYYLKDCGKLENNFLQFDQAIPTDTESSMLLIELVRIRFHDLQPNEQQKTYYTTLLEECMKHNVNPRFTWFRGFNYHVNVFDRSDEFEVEKRIKEPAYAAIVRNIINARELEYCNKAYNEFNLCEIMESLKFARGLDLSDTDIRVSKDSMVLFGILDIMNIVLSSNLEVVNPSPENELLSQQLQMCVHIYKNAYQNIHLQQYRLMTHTILLPFMDNPYQICKAYHQKFPFLFNESLYSPDLVLVAEHFVELLTKNTENKAGLSLKLKLLLRIAERRQQQGESQPSLTQQVKEELEGVTSMFISILDPKMSGEMYVNMVMMLWAITAQEMPWAIVLGPDVLTKVDIIRYIKRKTVLDQRKNEFFVAFIENILKNKEYQALDESTIIKYIEYMNREQLDDISLSSNPPSPQHLSVQYLLMLLRCLMREHLEQSPTILHWLFKSQSNPKDIRYSLFGKILGIKPRRIGAFLKVIKDAGLNKQWLEFVKKWGIEDDYYLSVMELHEGFDQLKKRVTPKTVLMLGSAELEGYLGAMLAFLGSDYLHAPAQELVQEIESENPLKTQLKECTLLALMMESSVRPSQLLDRFLLSNCSHINFNSSLNVKSPETLNALNKAVNRFFNLAIEEYQKCLSGLSKDLLKMDASQRTVYRERINHTFNFLRVIPENALSLCKPNPNSQDDENWESDKEEEEQDSSEQSQEDDKPKEEVKETKKKSKKHHDGEEQGDPDDHHDDDYHDHDDDDQSAEGYNDDQNIEKDQITNVLLEMRPGYKTYEKYIELRECLDILIRGNYGKLEDAAISKNLPKQQYDYLQAIAKLLNELHKENKRILEKMNPILLRILKGHFGVTHQGILEPSPTEVATKIKPFENDFSDSEDNDEDDQQGQDYDGDDDYDDEDDNIDGEHDASNHTADHADNQDEEERDPQEYKQQEKDEQHPQEQIEEQKDNQIGQQPQVINLPPGVQFVSVQQLLGQLFGGQIHHRRKRRQKKHEHQESLLYKDPEPGSLYLMFNSKQRYFRSEQFDKTIELLLYKLFDETNIDPLHSVYGKLLHSHYCCSILINSLIMLLRMTQKPQKNSVLKNYPMIWQDYPDTHSSQTMYDLYVDNAVEILRTLDKPDFYSELDPPIPPVQALANEMGLQSQPNIITLSLMLLKNPGDEFSETVDSIVDKWKLVPHIEEEEKKEDEEPIKLKTKHIETLCRESYNSKIVLHHYSTIAELIDLFPQKFLKIYLNTVGKMLGKDVSEMDQKITSLEAYILNKPEEAEQMTGVLNDLTRTHVRKFDVFYYSFKDMLRTLVEDDNFDEKKKKVLYDLINTDKTLIKVITTALHHLNFYNQHLNKPDKAIPKALDELMMNELTLVNIAFMVFAGYKKTITLAPASTIKAYLSANLLTPQFQSFPTLNAVSNLILPLLGLDMLCIPKYQKVLLPPIFENPSSGYHIPVNFRMITLEDQDEPSQIIEIRRGCSFDLAFYQMRRPRFRIQYFKQEGNDQGGLRREFMLGWQGFGIGEEASFIGRILAIAFRDEMLYGGRFDVSMALALTGYKIDLEFVKNDDPEMYKSLLWMKNNPVAELQQDFTHRRKYYDVDILDELKPNGKDIPVTDQNKDQFIDLLLKNKYFGGRQKELQHLRRGFFSIVPENCIKILTPYELLDRISGLDTFNIQQLRKNVSYEGYSNTSEIIQWFWQQVGSLDFKQKQTFLHFLTGTYKLPHGLKNYSFTIERVYDTDRLPVAHTCFNTLDLPEYTTYAVFKNKFRMAVFEGNDNYGIM